jgi:NADPH-dependent 2,4-dienoyl-CoA reductase/sulfur reductase-like enzyme
VAGGRPEIGAMLADLHREHGVRLRLGMGVAGLEKSGGRLRALALSAGSTVETGLALIASALTVDDGVVCDERCFAVGVEDVVAAGDVARWPHPLADGALVRVEHWSNAIEMGRTAGRNLVTTGAPHAPHAAVPTFWSDQYGLKLQSAGFLDRVAALDVVEGSLAERRFVAVGDRDGRLGAVVALGMVRRMVELEHQIGARATRADALARTPQDDDA